jgi:hypothetical protein
MHIENTEVYGFNKAIHAMRNPLDSWDKSDSHIDFTGNELLDYDKERNYNVERFRLGEADKKLSQKLTKAGSEHCKHLRLITVWFDITAPRFFHQEFDTYRHVEKVSGSTMHTLMKQPISQEDFEVGNISNETIDRLNRLIDDYKSADKEVKNNILFACKNILPEGFLQKRTVCTNYQTLYAILQQREHHRLPQWHYFCDWIKSLPWFVELTGLED